MPDQTPNKTPVVELQQQKASLDGIEAYLLAMADDTGAAGPLFLAYDGKPLMVCYESCHGFMAWSAGVDTKPEDSESASDRLVDALDRPIR